MLQPPCKGLVLGPWNFHPWKGPCPGLTSLQETKGHRAQEAGGHGRGRADWGLLGLGVDERGTWLSREYPVMSLSLPGPQSQPVTRGHAPSPRGSNKK